MSGFLVTFLNIFSGFLLGRKAAAAAEPAAAAARARRLETHTSMTFPPTLAQMPCLLPAQLVTQQHTRYQYRSRSRSRSWSQTGLI